MRARAIAFAFFCTLPFSVSEGLITAQSAQPAQAAKTTPAVKPVKPAPSVKAVKATPQTAHVVKTAGAAKVVKAAQVVKGAQSAQPAETASAAAGVGATYQDSTNELSVGVGKTVLVDTAKQIARVSVGLGDVAMAAAVSPTEIMINGKAPGETSLIIWDGNGGRQFFNVSVFASTAQVDDRLEGVRRELQTELPGQPVHLTLDNGTLFLRGTVSDLTSADRAVKIAETAGKVVNLLDVEVPKTPPQILLKVHFAAVDRTMEKQLGINIFSTGLGNVLGAVTTGQFAPPAVSGGAVGGSSGGSTTAGGSATVGSDLNLFAFLPGHNIGATLQALETKGVVETLAEPNLLAADGKEASFLAGGQFPYPVAQGTSGGSTAISIMFKEYGIRLSFIPTIMPQGTIRLQVAPEVSALDYANEVNLSGFEVPGITTRKVNTEVELKDGQSFVIGGLLDNSENETFEKIPFIGDIPILGKLFQSMVRTKNNTELIVIVTPEIVAPIPAGTPTPELKFPTSFMTSNSNIPMHTPDEKTPENTPAAPPTTLPVEKLIESMKPEKPLTSDNGSSSSYGGSSSGSSMGTPQQ